MARLQFIHANKIYDGGVHALKDFCLDVPDKKFVVFVGPSGCGKSTALRMIAGLEKISSGDIYIGDRLVNGLPPKERNIAMVFQSYALFPNMSVYDNISFGLRMQGEDKEVIKEKVESVAQMLNLTEYLKRKPNQLSGGQKQRVALGRAIVRHPDIFLLDEPLSNLDAKLRAKMRSEILALHHRLGATFVYVTHDQTEAMTMGDIIVVMKGGCIMQTGSPKFLYRHPANKFVASFLGSPQMNFWDGELCITQRGMLVKTSVADFPIEGELALRFDKRAMIDGKRVTLGIRPEDISAHKSKDNDVEIALDIDVVEELCTHTVLHGKIDECEVVGFGTSGMDVKGERISLFANLDKIHVFDAESEESLMPQYAQKTTVKCAKCGDKLSILGGGVNLPQSIAEALDDGDIDVDVPIEAFKDGDIPFVCKRVLESENGAISLVEANGIQLYAKGDFSSQCTFGLDVSRLSICGSKTIGAVREVSVLKFGYVKRNEKENGKTVTKHFCVLNGDIEVESFYEFNKKMYRLGKDIFRKTYDMHVSINNVRLARENECYPTIDAIVCDVVDYGDKQYSLVALGEQTMYVEGLWAKGEKVRLAMDLDSVHVSEANNKTILF